MALSVQNNFGSFSKFQSNIGTNLLFDDTRFRFVFSFRSDSLLDKEMINSLMDRVHSVEVPESSISLNKKNNNVLIPTGFSYGNIAVTFYETSKYDIRKTLDKWMTTFYDDQSTSSIYSGGAVANYLDESSATLSISTYEGNVAETFQNIMPTTSGSIKYDSSSEGNIVLITTNFMFTKRSIS